MSSDMTLYHIPGSPPCWRVMLCLEEKMLQGCNKKVLSIEKREQKSEEVLKLNPRGQVPTFVDGDTVINESLAVCLYLEDKFKAQGTCLLPSDHVAKAAVLQRMLESQNIAKKVLEDFMSIMWFNKPEKDDKELMKQKADKAREEIARWEKYLEQLGPGSYIAGKDFSLADVALLPALGLIMHMGLDTSSRPHLKAYFDMASERPSFIASRPPQYAGKKENGFLKDL